MPCSPKIVQKMYYCLSFTATTLTLFVDFCIMYTLLISIMPVAFVGSAVYKRDVDLVKFTHYHNFSIFDGTR